MQMGCRCATARELTNGQRVWFNGDMDERYLLEETGTVAAIHFSGRWEVFIGGQRVADFGYKHDAAAWLYHAGYVKIP